MGRSILIIAALGFLVGLGDGCGEKKSTSPDRGEYSIPVSSFFESSFDFSKGKLVDGMDGDIAALFSSSQEGVFIKAIPPAKIKDMGTGDFNERPEFDPEGTNLLLAVVGHYYAVETKEGDCAKFYVVEATFEEMVIDWWYPL